MDSKMPELLPLFPLRIVVFPEEPLNLHIFEPRYKELIEDCKRGESTFGIVAYIGKALQKIGTEIKLENIAKIYPDGKMDIQTKALGLFEVEKFYQNFPGKMYSGAVVKRMDYQLDGDPLFQVRLKNLLEELFEVLKIKNPFSEKENPTTYNIGHKCGLSLTEEYQLLSIFDEKDRQEYLIRHLERVIPMAKSMELLREKIQMNGHFKHIIPPDL